MNRYVLMFLMNRTDMFLMNRNNFQGTLSEKSKCGTMYMKCWQLCNKEKIWIACIVADCSGRTENRQR